MYGNYHYLYRPPVKKGDRKEWVPTDPEIFLSLSGNIAASGEATTAQLAAPAGKSSGTDFVAGRLQDDENPTDAVDITVDDYTEHEWCMKVAPHIADGTVYEFRLVQYLNGTETVFNTYTVTPTWTVGTPGAEAVRMEPMRIYRSW